MNECVMQVCSAILKLQKEVIKWPDEEESKAISAHIKQAHGFVNFVGLIDGTLFTLTFAPSQNLEDYFTRIQLMVYLFEMLQQRLPGLRWDGPAAYMTIGYGPTVMYTCQRRSILVTRSFYLVIRHSLHQ